MGLDEPNTNDDTFMGEEWTIRDREIAERVWGVCGEAGEREMYLGGYGSGSGGEEAEQGDTLIRAFASRYTPNE